MLQNTHAFPTHPDVRNKDDGMTLRDYFAAKAMQSLMTTDQSLMATDHTMIDIAETAYMMADRMVEERDDTNA